MMVAFIADTHDRLAHVDALVAMCHERDVDIVFHLGDITMPEVVERFGEFDFQWVTGNGDQTRKEALNDAVAAIGGETHGWGAKLYIGDAQFYCRHGMEHSLSYLVAAERDAVDYVMHGHWHNQERTEVGSSEVLNPGNDGAYLYDTDTDSFEWVEV